MLDTLLGNKTNILLLRFFARFDNQFFSIDDIIKETGAGLRNVYDSLRILSHEKMLVQKDISGKKYYKFVADSSIKELIYRLFEEEKKRVYVRANDRYKILAEIESKIIKAAGAELMDIFLFGSVAKGRDTAGSDIDLCVLVKKKDKAMEHRIRDIMMSRTSRPEIQILVFTSQEFIAASKAENPLVKSILRDGISLSVGN